MLVIITSHRFYYELLPQATTNKAKLELYKAFTKYINASSNLVDIMIIYKLTNSNLAFNLVDNIEQLRYFQEVIISKMDVEYCEVNPIS